MTSETRGRNILATELLKDGYHERAERVAAGNEFMSDEPAVRACVAAVGERPNVSARELLAAELDMPHLSTRVREASADAGVFITPSQALRAIEAALALPSPVRQGEDGEAIEAAFKEAYQLGFLEGYECEPRYELDAEGTAAALRLCDGTSEAWSDYRANLPAISPVRESVLEPGAIDRVMDLIEQQLCIIWWPVENRDIFVAALKDALDPDFTGHIDCPEDEGGSDHAD